MKLSPRLTEIISLLTPAEVVADIGTDHGLIPAYLVQFNLAKRVIATDISKGSLGKTVEYVREMALEEVIETRLGNGLEVLQPHEANGIIIAGMGGVLIRDILEASQEVVRTAEELILQPMTGMNELRRYLLAKDYHVAEERLVAEQDKIYEVIKVRGFGKNEEYLHFDLSPHWRKQPELYRKYLSSLISATLKILQSMGHSSSEQVLAKSERLKEALACYRKELEGLGEIREEGS